jgi:hypothetical protein
VGVTIEHFIPQEYSRIHFLPEIGAQAQVDHPYRCVLSAFGISFPSNRTGEEKVKLSP